MSAQKEITAICSGGSERKMSPHPVKIPNPKGKRFDEIDLSNTRCPSCGEIGRLLAMP